MSVTSIALIMPAFNVENYIGVSLESVRQQTVPFTELIVVDDGSTDSTPRIINQYLDLPNLRVVRTPNMGQSSARNLGAKLATSEFLYFLDSDDYIHPQLVESFLKVLALNPKLDLFAFSSALVDDNIDRGLSILNNRIYHSYSADNCLRGDTIFSQLIAENNFTCAVWSYVFRSSLINWKSCGFQRIIHEDEEFSPRVFINSKYVRITPNVLYFYRQRQGSIMRAHSFSLRRFLRSRYGYKVALMSCLSLLMQSIGNKNLSYSLLLRARYLFYHAFFLIYDFSLSLWLS